MGLSLDRLQNELTSARNRYEMSSSQQLRIFRQQVITKSPYSLRLFAPPGMYVMLSAVFIRDAHFPLHRNQSLNTLNPPYGISSISIGWALN